MKVLKAILPLILISILVIITIIRFKKIDTNDKRLADNMSLGISLGTLFGLSIALSLKIDITYGISFGMLIGIIASTYDYKNKKK